MTIAEKLEQRGLEKGKEAGIQIGREEGKTQGIKKCSLKYNFKRYGRKTSC